MTDARIGEVTTLLDACIPASADLDMPKFSDVTDVSALIRAFETEYEDGGNLYQKLVNALVRIKDGQKPQSVEGGVLAERLILEAYFTAPAIVEKLKDEPDRMLAEHKAIYNDYERLLSGVNLECKIYRCIL